MSTVAVPNEILDHLQEILADRRFASAERNAKFLRYVVESALEGRTHEIKETVIATEVYNRSSDYDPKSDSIVRVEASRLRQKLRSYYENEGKTSSVRIHLPSGTYVPVFEKLEPIESVTEPPPLAVAPVSMETVVPLPTPARQSPSMPRMSFAAVLAFLAIIITLQVARASRATDGQDLEATAAWQEGQTLLEQDPHTAQTTGGPPKILLRAIERLEFAVARKPDWPQAWATLAEAYDYVSGFHGRDPGEDSRRMEAAARRAIALNDKFAPGHHMLGLALKGTKWDLAQAEVSYRRALMLDPRNAYAAVEYADLLWETGRVNEAAEEIRKTRGILPSLPVLAVKEAELQLHQGLPDAAMVTAASAVEMKQTYLRAHIALGMAYEMNGDFTSALLRYEYVLQANPTDRRALPAYGYLLAKTGQTARAKEVLNRLEKINGSIRNCAVQIAVVHAGLGDEDRALDWLETAYRTRQSHFPFAAVEYRFRGLHQNPRFVALLKRAELKPVA